MDKVSKEDGILSMLAKRLVDERLPKALALKEKVDQGKVLENHDIVFLNRVLTDVSSIPPKVRDDPTFQNVAGRMVQLYKEITAKALENEKAQKSS